jgi:uncharacterized membrane protein YhaH (DUF805 family)
MSAWGIVIAEKQTNFDLVTYYVRALGVGLVTMNILTLFFGFYGRISRAKHWTGWAVSYAVIAAAMGAWALMPSSEGLSFTVGLICLICVFTLIPIAVKRLHDLDITGWWVAVFIVVYGFAVAPREPTVTSLGSVSLFIPVVWLGSKKGDPGGSRHGPPPS